MSSDQGCVPDTARRAKARLAQLRRPEQEVKGLGSATGERSSEMKGGGLSACELALMRSLVKTAYVCEGMHARPL
eukprot:2262649-Pleurochrysis_carterae.AAC.2